MSLIPPSLKFIIMFATFGFLVFISFVHFHDNGAPDSLTQEERASVIETIQATNEKSVVFIDLMKKYQANPERDVEILPALIRALDDFMASLKQTGQSRLFLVRNVQWDDDQSKAALAAFWRLEREFTKVHDGFTSSVKRRIQEESDAGKEQEAEARYQPYYNVLRKYAGPFSAGTDFCSPSECFWCQCRKYCGLN